MSIQDYRCKLEEDKFYHIYNRGNNGEKLFYTEANYKFFLKKYDECLSNYLETYAFCLLPNHFHLLVKVTSRENVSHLNNVKHLKADELDQLSKAFKQMFTSYAKAINKQENRHGSLFEKPFKRIEITSVNYLTNLVFYIHANPQLHGIIDNFKMYRWSSYERILNNKTTKLKKEEVLTWFDDRSNFVTFHKQKEALAIERELLIED